MTDHTPTPTQPPATVPEARLTRQQLADRFSFLEGVVNECNYLRIIDTACAIYGEGATAAALSAAAPAATQAEQPGAAVDEHAAFEAWAAGAYEDIDLERDGDGYVYSLASEWWMSWKARAALAAPAPITEQAGAPLPQGAEAVGADGWPKLTAEAKTAGGSFGKGVSARLLVEACYRRAAFENERQAMTPDAMRDEERRRRALWEMVNGPLESAAPGGEAPADSDPLQGAANWLVEAVGDCEPGDIQHRLFIGFNQAKRLYDAAMAAQSQKGAA